MAEESAIIDSFTCAVVQLCSTEDPSANLETAIGLIHEAAESGAQCIALPENFAWLALSSHTLHPSMPLDGDVVGRMKEVAQKKEIHLLLGSISEPGPDKEHTYNTSVWIAPDGEILGTYRKIHLFDIDIPGAETHLESARIAPGNDVTCIKTDLGTFGLSICYDLRFPELYRSLVDHGADILCVPSAFTQTTGKDHWHPLLRARAIENQSYVIAPGQWGHHGGKRYSFGHSVIIDPWGTIIGEVTDGTGYAIASIDLGQTRRIRQQLPALEHRRTDLWR